MKLSHRCIITRLRLNLSQRELAIKILASQPHVADFEDDNYMRLNKRSTELLTGILLDVDYHDLKWTEMAVLKLKEGKMPISKLSRKIGIPASQISLVLSGKDNGKVGAERIRAIRRYIDGLGLYNIALNRELKA